MTHKESERCSKHNDDVETVVGKQGSGPGSARKGDKREKMCGNENVGNITPFLSWCYPVATFQASQNDVVLVVSIVGRVVHANPPINEANIAILIAPVAGLLVMEVVVPRAANTTRRERLGGVVRGLARRGR